MEVFKGRVLVAKHPVIHPGDVRILTAVDVPELKGLFNVLLFSKQGTRPEPSKLAGSDLDGDQYAVTWAEDLFPPDASNPHPQSYAPAAPPPPLDEVKEEHLRKHFIDFGRTDNLGSIANAWLVHADRQRAGCDGCTKLAELHSKAVDFPKSGVAVQMPSELRPQEWPHWMEKKGGTRYESSSILGVLYDDLNKLTATGIPPTSASSQLDRFLSEGSTEWQRGGAGRGMRQMQDRAFQSCFARWPQKPSGVDLGPHSFSLPALFKHLLSAARVERQHFENSLLAVMNRYRVRNEAQLLTGCLHKYHKFQKRRQHDVAAQVKMEVSHIRRHFRFRFLQEAFYYARVTPPDPLRLLWGAEGEEGMEDIGSGETEEGGKESEDGLSLQRKLEVIEGAAAYILGESARRFYSVRSSEVQIDWAPVFTSEELVRLRFFFRALGVACYRATYSYEDSTTHGGKEGGGGGCVPLFSFPWVVAFKELLNGVSMIATALQS